MAHPSAGSEVSDKSFREQFASLGAVYWIAGWIELVERFAYYGVRIISPLFFVAALKEGGLELSQEQKGQIWAVWAIVQSFVPILSGGFADRYGYKLNIAASTVLKIIGYVIMGYSVTIAEFLCGMPLSEARPKGADHVYEIFFIGAMFLAGGTAIFKPGVQGLVASTIPKSASSLGWGLFYQMVNIGAFIGPILAGYLRVMKWEYVFLTCSAAIALNFIPLFFFKEPVRHYAEGEKPPGPGKILIDSLRGLLEPRLFFFTLAFCGFWLMNQQFFDILPNFIDDWIDSRGAASALQGILGDKVPIVHGGNLTQEWMTGLNALLVGIFAFLVGYLTGRMQSLSSIIAGIVCAIVAVFCLATNMSGWWILGCIALYSLGEMMAAPTQLRFLTKIAPPGKIGLYMGFSNFTVGIGWSIGSIMAGHLYGKGGDKVELAKRYLIEKHGVDAELLKGMTKDKILPFFEQTVGVDAWQTRQLLWDTYHPYMMWLIFGAIGLVSLTALIFYNRALQKADANPSHPLNTVGEKLVLGFLIPCCVVLVGATFWAPSLGLGLNAGFFVMMLIVALFDPARHRQGRSSEMVG